MASASGKVIDIIEALQKSLEKVRVEKRQPLKPPGRAAASQKSRRRRA